MRKFLNNRLSTEPDSDRKHIQHLKHDFQVFQLLQSSTNVHNNRQSYIDILNQVSFNNHHKRRQIKMINNQLNSLVDKNQTTLRLSTQFSTNLRQNDLRDFQKKILEQEEVKSNLRVQSEQILKSINLLRGDVGRLIQKNESTDILQKKTSKVKIVAQDQFKKVNLALQKDHDEISERNSMQIRFNKKLKNICNSQNNILKKIQGEYIRLQKRKKVIIQKISRMQEIMKVLNDRQKTKQQTKIVNQRNRLHLEEIMNLLRIVNQIKSDNKQIYKHEDDENDDGVIQSHLSLKTQRFKSKIKQMEGQISQYICKLAEQIHKSQNFLRVTSDNLQQSKNKLKQLEVQKVNYIQFLAGCKYDSITKQERLFYEEKLKQFKRVTSLILIIWQYIQNNNNVTVLIDNQIDNDFVMSKKQQSPSRFYRRSEEFAKNSGLISEQNNYTNKILALLLYLSGNGEQVNLQNDYLMKSMEMTIVMWLKGFKNILQSHQSQKKTFEHSDKLKKARSMQSQKFKSTMQILQQNSKQDDLRLYRTSLCQQQQDKLKTMLELISPKKSFINSQQYQQPQHRFHKTEGNQEYCKPSRVKLLQKADHDYYKMLKNVLQIEKENIKKNYDFNKKFNRAKFTQKNIIQEQKRFQSKFALQFIQKNDKIGRNFVQSRNTIISKDNSRQKIFRQRRQYHYLTMSNFKADRVEDLSSSRKHSTKKPKQSFFNPQKLQRKSKLVNRQSQQGLNVKESRISILSAKRGLINFAENTINQQY